MTRARISKGDMPNYTFERLTDELRITQANLLTEEVKVTRADETYVSDLQEEILRKPKGLTLLIGKADLYIAENTNKPPSERLPISIPKKLGTWFDWGLSCTGLVTTNQSYIDRTKNIASTALTLITANSRNGLFDPTATIQQVLRDLDTIYTEMHNANIKKGRVIDMLRETFHAYSFIPTKDRVPQAAVAPHA